MAAAADSVVSRQPQVQSEAIGGWGGSAAGSADFLSRLARAEMRDASSLKTLKGPKVRHDSPRWTSVRVAGEVPDAAENTAAENTARAIDELTLAEEERLSPSSRRSSTSPAAVACPSLATTANPDAKPVPAGSGAPRRSWRWPSSPPLRRPASAFGWVGAISPPWRRSLSAAAVAEAHSEPPSWQTKWQPPAVEQSRRGEDEVEVVIEHACTKEKQLVEHAVDASRSASPIMRVFQSLFATSLRQRLYGPSLGEPSPLGQSVSGEYGVPEEGQLRRQRAVRREEQQEWREEQLECAAFLQRRSSTKDMQADMQHTL